MPVCSDALLLESTLTAACPFAVPGRVFWTCKPFGDHNGTQQPYNYFAVGALLFYSHKHKVTNSNRNTITAQRNNPDRNA